MKDFNKEIVKPGDELDLRNGWYYPYRFIGFSSDGMVVVEDSKGNVSKRKPRNLSHPNQTRI